MIGIYAIFRKSDDRCMYVGESKNIERRLYMHFQGHTHINVNNTEYYGKTIEEHNIDNKQYRLDREAYWINVLKPEFNDVRNRHKSEESIKKIIKNHVGFSGKHHSEDTRKNISKNCPNHSGKNNPMYGKSPWNKGKKKNKETGKYE